MVEKKSKPELKELKRQYDKLRRGNYSPEQRIALRERKLRYNRSEKGKACIKRANEKRTSTPEGLIASRIRAQIYMRLCGRVRGFFRHLPYTPEELKIHLEKTFLSGMSWENRTLWHIDHIIPLKFKDSNGKFFWNQAELADVLSETFRNAWGLNNLKTLWGIDNIRKSNKAAF